MHEQLSNIRESIASARASKGVVAAPLSQNARFQQQQNPMRNFIEEYVSWLCLQDAENFANLTTTFFSSQRLQSTDQSGSNMSFPFVHEKNLNSTMSNSRPFSDCSRDAASLSQATTTIADASVLGGDDSFRKQHRGSQGSGGNFSSQDKFSFTGSDTIDIMGLYNFAAMLCSIALFLILLTLSQKLFDPLKKTSAFSKT